MPGALRRCLGLALPVALLATGCAHLSRAQVERHGITEAHAMQTFRLGPLSALRASSYVTGHGPARDADLRRLATRSTGAVTIDVDASERLRHDGIDADEAAILVALLARLLDVLPAYTGRAAPVRRIEAGLVDPDEPFARHRWSWSANRRHALRMTVAYATADRDAARREALRTFAHELLHVDLGAQGRSREARRLEEPAATALAHCVEVDVFGSTSLPPGQGWSDASEDSAMSRSMASDAARDRELAAIFGRRTVLAAVEADPLRALCRARIRMVSKPATGAVPR